MNNIFKNKFFQIIICLVIAIIIYLILIIITNSNNFKNKTLNANTNSIFTINDLSINNSKYKDILNSVVTEFGTPNKVEEFKDNKINYKTYYYDGLELTFKEEQEEFILMKVKLTSKDYTISRNIKIGDNINNVMNKFLIINEKGSYLYGNYTENNINGKKVKENIYYGKREKNIVYYLYMEEPYKKEYASYNDDIVTLTFKVSYNKVKEIEWIYGSLQ